MIQMIRVRVGNGDSRRRESRSRIKGELRDMVLTLQIADGTGKQSLPVAPREEQGIRTGCSALLEAVAQGV